MKLIHLKYLHEFLNLELKIVRKFCKVLPLYSFGKLRIKF